jgi:hypothetical protein
MGTLSPVSHRVLLQRLAGMTREEQLDYWRKQTELLRERQASLRAARPLPSAPVTRTSYCRVLYTSSPFC